MKIKTSCYFTATLFFILFICYLASTPTTVQAEEVAQNNIPESEEPSRGNLEDALNHMGKAFAKGIKDMLIIASRKLGNVGAGFGEWLKVAMKNLPDIQLKEYRNKNEEYQQGVKNLLVGVYLMCQFQFMVEGSATCSNNDLNTYETLLKEYKDYVVFIDPSKNSKDDLLISGYHTQVGDIWEINHEGKQSLRVARHNDKRGI